MSEKVPNIGDRRVAYCAEAGREVVQELVKGWEIEGEPDTEWLCLHNDTPSQDAKEVKKFREQNPQI